MLYRDIRLLLDPPADIAPLPLTDRRVGRTIESGHGRALERRTGRLDRSHGYLDWPGLAQVFRLERTWREQGIAQRALHDGIMSLAPADADPARTPA